MSQIKVQTAEKSAFVFTQSNKTNIISFVQSFKTNITTSRQSTLANTAKSATYASVASNKNQNSQKS
jgi:hypothetical protein